MLGGLAVAVLFVTVFLAVDDVKNTALSLLKWFEGLGAAGWLLYFGLYVMIVLLLLPGILLTLGAGFLFGFWLGGAVVVGALSAGSGLAFLIARHAMGERLASRILQNKRIRAFDTGLQKEGWKIVLLSRFVPVFPFKISNYFFGLTSMRFSHFFFANLVGVLPLSLTNVYLGSLTAELADLTERRPSPLEWVLYGMGFLAAVGLIYYLTGLARRMMREALDEETREEALEGDSVMERR